MGRMARNRGITEFAQSRITHEDLGMSKEEFEKLMRIVFGLDEGEEDG